jgi:hypothetical protein
VNLSTFERTKGMSMLGSTRRFLADLGAFACRNGISVAATMALGAFLEGAGLVTCFA